MFFRRKSLTLEGIDERLSVVEIALGITRTDMPREPPELSNGLRAALASYRKALRRDLAKREVDAE